MYDGCKLSYQIDRSKKGSDVIRLPLNNSFKKILSGLVLQALPFFVVSQNFTISGFVRDVDSGENLIGSTILDLRSGKGTIANAYGFYSLTLPSDTISLQISFVGYQTITESFYLSENKSINYNPKSGSILSEVVITADEAIEALPQMSSISVPIEQIKNTPMLMGETDVLKAIQLLPGVQSGSEGSSGIYVRGGGPDQNLILMDGVPVYNASHLFGFFSVFNAEAINNVSLIKGGFPARYGGRLSSVIDMSMKEGNNKEQKGSASIGLLSSKATLEGPLGNGKTSYIISARRTYIDLLMRPLIKSATDGDEVVGYFFQDLNGKINHTFSDRDRVYLSIYTGKDKFYGLSKGEYGYGNYHEKYRDEAGIRWGNVISAARWNHVFSQKLFANFTATFSNYQFRVFEDYETERTENGSTQNIEERTNYDSGIRDWAVKADFDFLPHSDHSLKFGMMAITHLFEPGVFNFISSSENNNSLGAKETNTTEFSAYIEDDLSLSNSLRFNIGIHASNFNVRGQSFYSVQPRLTARMLLNSGIALKASYSEMTQFIHLLSNGGIGLPTDLWVPTTDQIRPQEAWQAAVGAARTIGKWEVSLEGYYKNMENLIEYEDGATFFNTSDDWEEKVVSGDGTSYGVEFLLQKKTGRMTGWFGSTWSKTDRTFEQLNFGETYPYKYDRRIDISIVSSYKISDRISLSGTWVYGTGNAISLPDSKSYPRVETENGIVSPTYSEVEYYPERNNYRMRAYHRLDVGIAMSKKKKRGIRTWSLGFYNFYSQRNPFYMERQYTENGERFVQYSLFPILPYFNYKFEF